MTVRFFVYGVDLVVGIVAMLGFFLEALSGAFAVSGVPRMAGGRAGVDTHAKVNGVGEVERQDGERNERGGAEVAGLGRGVWVGSKNALCACVLIDIDPEHLYLICGEVRTCLDISGFPSF